MNDDVQILINKYGYWGEHPEHKVEMWLDEIANDRTRMSYWDWVDGRESDGEEK